MFINTHVSNSLKPQENCKNYYLFTVLRYLSSYGRQYVRFISKNLKKDFDLNLFTAQIEQGIYMEPLRKKGSSNNFKQQCEHTQVEKILEKFNMIDENFIYILSLEFVDKYLREDLKEYPAELEKEFVEICITYATILLMSEKEEFAQVILERVIKICKELKYYEGIFKLELMLISLHVNNNKVFAEIDSRLNDLKDNVLEQTSPQFKKEGLAELNVMLAIRDIKNFNMQKDLNPR